MSQCKEVGLKLEMLETDKKEEIFEQIFSFNFVCISFSKYLNAQCKIINNELLVPNYFLL